MRLVLSYVTVALACFIGCSGTDRQEDVATQTAAKEVVAEPEEAMIALASSAFTPGGQIPTKYTGEGEDVSPPLAWSGAPDGTMELALICDDPDAPRPEPWVHWVLYAIPAGTDSLAEGGTGVGLEGKTSWGATGYGGPMPPPGHGTHHYRFRLYALGQTLALEAGATKDELLSAMKGLVLAHGELVGTYER